MKKATLTAVLAFGLLIAVVPALMAGGSPESGSSAPRSYPFTKKSLGRILDGEKNLSFMAGALRKTGLEAQMEQLDGYTLFVPTDDVVARLPERLRNAMESDPQVLLDVLTAQMVKGILPSDELEKLSQVTTMAETRLKIGRRGERITVAESDLVRADLYGKGFVVHVVTGIVIPAVKL